MKFTLHVTIDDDEETTQLEEVITLEKSAETTNCIGLTLAESKALLKTLQYTVIQHQAAAYTRDQRCCPHCQTQRRIKGSTVVKYRTLFGGSSTGPLIDPFALDTLPYPVGHLLPTGLDTGN